MKNHNKLRVTIIGLTLISVLCLSCSTLYTLGTLGWARSQGLYATPQEAVNSLVEQHYRGVERVIFQHAGTNSFDGSNSHVWYVIYTVYADSHIDGSPLYHGGIYENAGHFYLHMKDGWVLMPEGLFPTFIGFWMKVLRIAG